MSADRPFVDVLAWVPRRRYHRPHCAGPIGWCPCVGYRRRRAIGAHLVVHDRQARRL